MNSNHLATFETFGHLDHSEKREFTSDEMEFQATAVFAVECAEPPVSDGRPILQGKFRFSTMKHPAISNAGTARHKTHPQRGLITIQNKAVFPCRISCRPPV